MLREKIAGAGAGMTPAPAPSPPAGELAEAAEDAALALKGRRVQLWSASGERLIFEGFVERIACAHGECEALVAAAGANQIKKWIPLRELRLDGRRVI